MSNAVFVPPAGLAWSVFKTPIFRTKTFEAVSGKELRAAFMSYPLYQFDLSFEVLRADAVNSELQYVLGFFNARAGSFDSFLYTDPTDNAVTGQNFGTGDGSAKSFQLVRTYGGFTEPVQNVNGTPSIYVGGVLKTPTTDYSISSTGVVTFVTAPANGAALTWTGNFYYRVRLLQDQAQFENFMHQLWTLKKLSFQTVKQ